MAAYQDVNSGLTAGTAYSYRVRAYTSGGNSGYSNAVTVTTPFPPLSAGDVVLYAAEAGVKVGSWGAVSDSTAAGGQRLENPNAGATRINTPLASPVHYLEMSFNAEAGRPYRLWIRGRAYNNNGYNDSVYAQFSGSVDAAGAPVSRIGTTSAEMVNLEDCSGCGLSEWGWQDNGFGSGVLGPEIYFAATGPQTIRIQVREDGLSIDQIVISPDTYLFTAPGAQKLDTTILGKQGGTDPPPPPPPAPAAASVVADAYVQAGSSASSNFGSLPQLIAKFSADTRYERETYLKLDVSGVQTGDLVWLRLLGQLSDTREPSVTAGIYVAPDTAWSEGTITWNTRPAASPTQGGLVVVSGTTPQWYEVDLTTAIQAERSAGKNLVTLVLKNSVDTSPYAWFSSRETADGPQVLMGSSSGGSASASLIQADALVRGGPHASTNFGAHPELIAKVSSTPEYNREAYLKLDISGAGADDTVLLRLLGRLSDTREASVTTVVHAASDTSWSEDSLTWDSRPPANPAVLATLMVTGTTPQWYEIDLTEFVLDQKDTGADLATIVLKGSSDTLPYATFNSREAELGPELVVSSSS